MTRITASRPSPAVLVAVLALVVGLGGTAIAADPVAKLTKAKVKKIANKQIDKRFPVGTSQIADGATTGAKLAAGAVTATKLGPVTTRSTDVSVTAGVVSDPTSASCAPGELLLSGGASGGSGGTFLLVNSYPNTSLANSWTVRAINQGASSATLHVWALCLLP